MSWLVTFQAQPEYVEKYPKDDPRVVIRVSTPMEGRSVSIAWDQLSKLRRFATKDNHFLYSAVREG